MLQSKIKITLIVCLIMGFGCSKPDKYREIYEAVFEQIPPKSLTITYASHDMVRRVGVDEESLELELQGEPEVLRTLIDNRVTRSATSVHEPVPMIFKIVSENTSLDMLLENAPMWFSDAKPLSKQMTSDRGGMKLEYQGTGGKIDVWLLQRGNERIFVDWGQNKMKLVYSDPWMQIKKGESGQHKAY